MNTFGENNSCVRGSCPRVFLFLFLFSRRTPPGPSSILSLVFPSCEIRVQFLYRGCFVILRKGNVISKRHARIDHRNSYSKWRAIPHRASDVLSSTVTHFERRFESKRNKRGRIERKILSRTADEESLVG